MASVPITTDAEQGSARLNSILGPLDTGDQFGIPAGLASCGIPVFPLRPNSKIPYPGTRGLKDATTDPERVRQHQDRNPDDNWGACTGHGVDVLDVDVKDGLNGIKTLHRALHAGIVWRGLAETTTPSGGLHLWYPSTGGGNHAGLLGLDYRGRGGYVLIPPSRIDGAPYELTPESDTTTIVAPISWGALKSYLKPSKRRRPPPEVAHKLAHDHENISRWVSELQPGQRNSGLFWAACKLTESGQDPEVLRPAAQFTGLDDNEISAVLGSAEQRVVR